MNEKGRKSCSKKHGSWWYRLDAGPDPLTRKRRQIAKGGFATKQQAQAALAEAMTDAVRAHIGGVPQTYVSVIAPQGARVVSSCAS